MSHSIKKSPPMNRWAFLAEIGMPLFHDHDLANLDVGADLYFNEIHTSR